jgi:UDP-N-acetylmuramate dehydrogenase
MSDGRYKIPTGWLIDKAGLRGYRSHGMRVYEKNALVLVNDSATGYGDLAAIREEIVQIVFDKFGIKIEQEPLELS